MRISGWVGGWVSTKANGFAQEEAIAAYAETYQESDVTIQSSPDAPAAGRRDNFPSKFLMYINTQNSNGIKRQASIGHLYFLGGEDCHA